MLRCFFLQVPVTKQLSNTCGTRPRSYVQVMFYMLEFRNRIWSTVGDFTFWISLSLSKRLSETVNLSPKIRSKTEVWIRFQLRLSLSEKIISRL